MTQSEIFKINSLKFDGRIHRSWKAEIISETNELIIFRGVFENEITHPSLGVIRRNTVSHEFYWKNRWYNIFRFHEPEGNLRNYYCNISQPPTIKNNVLNYIDLDVDVLVQKDFSFEVLDFDEFEDNAVRFGYSLELREKVGKSLCEVLELIKNRDFPFDRNKTKL